MTPPFAHALHVHHHFLSAATVHFNEHGSLHTDYDVIESTLAGTFVCGVDSDGVFETASTREPVRIVTVLRSQGGEGRE